MARLHSIGRLAVKFGRIPRGRRFLIVEASFWLALARLVLLFVPFRSIASRLGDFVSPSGARTRLDQVPISPAQTALAREIGWAVTRAARYLPFRAVCLPQAIAARVMLGRRGVASVLHFGAAKGETKAIETHAWLDAAGVDVTGYPVARNFVEVACFL
jgi:hypothetical protein